MTRDRHAWGMAFEPDNGKLATRVNASDLSDESNLCSRVFSVRLRDVHYRHHVDRLEKAGERISSVTNIAASVVVDVRLIGIRVVGTIV